jgi:Tol biopolymer transport system component
MARSLSIALACIGLFLPSFARTADPTQVTTTGGVRPTASRDGNWIAYQSGINIMKIPSAGGSPTTLFTGGTEPNWERPGDLIVFRGGGIRTVDATTLAVATVYSGSGYDDDPSWSPLGDEIALQGSSISIAIISYPGAVFSIIPCSDPDLSGCEGEGPTWAPDGSALAFEDGLDLLKVARAGGTAELLLHWEADLTEPAWSPNGDWIAVSMGNPNAIDSLTAEQNHLWLVDARGSAFGLVQLTSGQVQDKNPAWSPDGNTIYFDSDRSGVSEIWKLVLEPLPVKPVTWGQVKQMYRKRE